MDDQWKIPPKSKELLTDPNLIAKRLQTLIGQKFHLTRKTRTDGANLRNLVAETLINFPLPIPSNNFSILSDKGKGIPRMVREYIDTYIVTSGDSYNLQVWN